MNRGSILGLLAVAALGLVVGPTGAVSQQGSLKQQLVGSWMLVSIIATDKAGGKTRNAPTPALDQLAAHDAQKAELVKLRYFAGLSIEETAAALGISERTAKRHWTYSRAWLLDAMRAG